MGTSVRGTEYGHAVNAAAKRAVRSTGKAAGVVADKAVEARDFVTSFLGAAFGIKSKPVVRSSDVAKRVARRTSR